MANFLEISQCDATYQYTSADDPSASITDPLLKGYAKEAQFKGSRFWAERSWWEVFRSI
jgi:hypothetical protein